MRRNSVSFMLWLLLGVILPFLVVAEESPFPERMLRHGKEVLGRVWDEGITKGERVRFESRIPTPIKDFRSERLIWSLGDTDFKANIESLGVEFASEEEGKRFQVLVKFEDRFLVVYHEYPYFPVHASGIRISTFDLSKSWGTYVHGKDVPGLIVLLIPVEKSASRALALCPRDVKSRRTLLPVEPSTYRLSAMTAQFSFSGKIAFPTDRGEGAIGARVMPGRFSPRSSELAWLTEGKNPSLSFEFVNQTENERSFVSVSEDDMLPYAHVQVQAILQNHAGYRKKEQVDLVQWFQRIPTNEETVLSVPSRGGEEELSLAEGECVLSLFTFGEERSFSRVEESSKASDSAEEVG